MAMTAQGSNRAVPYINVTPLIDVLLVMLIIFMVITPLKPSRFMADIPAQRELIELTELAVEIQAKPSTGSYLSFL